MFVIPLLSTILLRLCIKVLLYHGYNKVYNRECELEIFLHSTFIKTDNLINQQENIVSLTSKKFTGL